MDRREFIKKSLQAGAASIAMLNMKVPLINSAETSSTVAVVRNGSPEEMVTKAVEMLGGIARFVSKGDNVVIKPNIGWARRPEQAANTNPEVVAAIVRLCKSAGAGKIKVFDNTCNETKRCYVMSGIQKAAENAGADVIYVFPQKFKKTDIPNGKILKSWQFYKDALDADVFINVPIVKHHSLSRMTMGMKNMMGILGGNRGKIHNQFDQKLADINTVVKPTLTILDAVNVLMRNGPVGGNVNDVKSFNTIVAGVDPVAVDSYGASFFDLKGMDLGFLRKAHAMGLGEIDLSLVKVNELNLSG